MCLDQLRYVNLFQKYILWNPNRDLSIPDENWASESRCARRGHTMGFEDLVWKETQNVPLNFLYIDGMMKYFGYSGFNRVDSLNNLGLTWEGLRVWTIHYHQSTTCSTAGWTYGYELHVKRADCGTRAATDSGGSPHRHRGMVLYHRKNSLFKCGS